MEFESDETENSFNDDTNENHSSESSEATDDEVKFMNYYDF